MPVLTTTASDGEARRDAALNRLRVRRPALVRRVQRVFLRHLLDDGPATSDAARAVVPIPKGIDPRFVGSAVRALAADYGLITSVGREPSRRPVAHARKNDIWAMCDRPAAEDWLMNHPELSDDPVPFTFTNDYVI